MRLLTSTSAAIVAFFTAMGYLALSDYFAAFGLEHMLMSLSAYPMMVRFGFQVMSNTPQALPILLAIALYIAMARYALKSRRRFPNVIYRAKGKPYRDGFISGWLNVVFNRQIAESFRIWAGPTFTGMMLLFVMMSGAYAEARSQVMIDAALSGHPIGMLNATTVTERVVLDAKLQHSLLPITHGQPMRLLWDSDRELIATVTPRFMEAPFTLPIIHIDKSTGRFYSVPLTFHVFKASRPVRSSPFFSTFLLTLGLLMLLVGLIVAVFAYFETKSRIADLIITWHTGGQEMLQLPLRIAQRMYDALVDGQSVEFRENGKAVRNRLYRLSTNDKIELSYTTNDVSVKAVVDAAIRVLQSRR